MYIHAPSFAPALTGEEVCRSLAMIEDHVLAVIPKGRDVWEVHVDQQELRDKIEVEGLVLRGRLCEVSPRFPGGTWVRVRGLPLDAKNTYVDRIIGEYGTVVVGTSYSTWRNTAIKTGERTLKIKLERDIPGRLKTKEYSWITLRYRDQPDLCFQCGLAGHQQWECEEVSGKSYSSAVQGVDGATATPPQPTASQPEDLSFGMESEETSTEETFEEKRKRKDRKEKKEKREREKKDRKRDLTPDSTPVKFLFLPATHIGLPVQAPVSNRHIDKASKK